MRRLALAGLLAALAAALTLDGCSRQPHPSVTVNVNANNGAPGPVAPTPVAQATTPVAADAAPPVAPAASPPSLD